MRVLLIYPPYELEQRARHFPVGLAYVAAALRAAGHAVRVVDMEGEGLNLAAAARRIAEGPADLVGLGGMVTRYVWVKKLVPVIRAAMPSAFVVAGNSGAATVPHLYLRHAGVDACCLGEGETPIVRLAEELAAGRGPASVPGWAYLAEGNVVTTGPASRVEDPSSLPRPAWDLFPVERYVASPDHRRPGCRHFDVVASRGCPYDCTFCYRIYGRRVTRRTPPDVVAEVEELGRRYDVNVVGFRDDLFMHNRRWLYQICDLLEKAKPRVAWSCLGRVDLVDEDMLRRMRTAGCFWISYGVESASPAILDEMRKSQTPAQALTALRLTAAAGIHGDASFLIGMPGETPATVADTVRFCREADITATFNYVTPYPGSELYEWAKRRGVIDGEEDYISRLGTATDLVVNLTAMPDDSLTALKLRAERAIAAAYFRRHPLRGTTAALRRLVENMGIGGAGRRLIRTLMGRGAT